MIDETVEARIARSVAERRCAYCSKDLKDERLVGTGSFEDGIFCSLDCYTKFDGTKLANLRESALNRMSSGNSKSYPKKG